MLRRAVAGAAVLSALLWAAVPPLPAAQTADAPAPAPGTAPASPPPGAPAPPSAPAPSTPPEDAPAPAPAVPPAPSPAAKPGPAAPESAPAAAAPPGAQGALAWPEGTGRIEGRILMPDGKTPAAGAVLTAIHLVSGRTFPAEPTSEGGSYRIDNLPYGYFEFAVESGGTLFAVTRPLDLPPGLAETMEVRLSDGGPPPPGTENLENGLVLTGFDRRATAVAVPLGSDKDSSRWTKKKTAYIGGAALLALLLLQ